MSWSIAALFGVSLPCLLIVRGEPRRDVWFWLAVAMALAGPLAWVGSQLGAGWHTGFAAAIWVTIAATMSLFAVAAAFSRDAWRLAPLLALVLALYGGIAVLYPKTLQPALLVIPGQTSWIVVHIATAVITYGLVTIAAVAALGAFLQERALKRKLPAGRLRVLPSIRDCEGLCMRLLRLGEGVLAVGVATGMAIEYRETGHLLDLSHKTVLTLAAFAVIGGLLAAHAWAGLRGRRAARLVLCGYLLLTLGYPGVKFVHDVLMT